MILSVERMHTAKNLQLAYTYGSLIMYVIVKPAVVIPVAVYIELGAAGFSVEDSYRKELASA